MEHLNRLVKTAIEGLGANKSKAAIARAGRAIGVIDSCARSFDMDLGVAVPSGRHYDKSKESDVKAIVEQLLESDVFEPSSTNKHNSFSAFKHSSTEGKRPQGMDDSALCHSQPATYTHTQKWGGE